ncbi:MAG: hypothetical protein U9N84_00660 [Actinomycetota bacterium]|nr:hypothetical protein [Actinomycetota bacterium]
MKRFPLLVVLLAIVASGCRAEVRVLLDVAEDGSGTLAAEVAVDQQLSDLIDQFAGDTDTIISGLDLGLEGTSTTRVEGDLTVYETTATFSDVQSVAEVAAGNFTSFALELTEEGSSLEATLDLAGELDLTQFPLDPNTIDSETLDARIIVSLPGEPADHNADEVLEDGRFVWTIPLDSDLYMFADTLYPKSGFPWGLVGILALAVGLALAVWLAAVRREKTSGGAHRPAPEPPPIEKPVADTPFFDMDH